MPFHHTMRAARTTIGASALAGFTFTALTAQASAQFALNPEFVVNQATGGDQRSYRSSDHASRMVDELSNGDRIVAYYDSANARHRVVILDAADTPVTQVDLGASSVSSAAVAALSTGGFVAVYSDGLDCDVALFNNNGTPNGGPVLADAGAGAATQEYCDVAPLPGGDFVVTWADTGSGNYDIFARRFDNTGGPQTGEITVDNRAGDQTYPVIEPRASGGYVITWTDRNGFDGSGPGTYMRAYDALDTPETISPVLVNTITRAAENFGVAAPLSDGNIAFSYYSSTTVDRYFRVLQPDGTQIVAETLIPDSSESGDLIALSDGRFLSIHSSSGFDNIRLIEYQNDGTLFSDTEVNQTTGGFQQVPRAGVFSDDSFLFTYTDLSNAVDGSGATVLARSGSGTPASAVAQASLAATSTFSGQTIASESGASLAGDVVIDFGLADRFIGMGAGGEVELTATLTNARLTRPVDTGDFTQPGDGDCALQIASGGGTGGASVGFVSTGQINQCSGFSANTGSLLLPIEVITSGQPVSVDVSFTPTADAGGYSGDDASLDLVAFASAFDFTIAPGAAGSGTFDQDGDDYIGAAAIGTIALASFGSVNIDLATPLSDPSDMIASGELVVNFPLGTTGIGGLSVNGAPCAAPDASSVTCALSAATFDAMAGGSVDITIDDDSDAATVIAPQTPTATLSVTEITASGHTIAGTGPGVIAPLERDDGLSASLLATDFAWAKIGSGGTASNFRLSGPFSTGASGAIAQVIVHLGAGNNAAFPASITLTASDTPIIGYRQNGDVISFTSTGLGAAANASGNADITGIELIYDEAVFCDSGANHDCDPGETDLSGAVQASRLLITSSNLGLSDL